RARTRCSILSSPPRRRGSAWAFPSAERLSSPTRGACGQLRAPGGVLFSNSPCPCVPRTRMNSPNSIVYVIDDDASVREALSNLLESVGLYAAVFSSTEEFLRANRPAVPSCLVLDVTLPGMNGLEFQEMLSKSGNPIPIVFITAFGDIPMTSRAMKAGAVE